MLGPAFRPLPGQITVVWLAPALGLTYRYRPVDKVDQLSWSAAGSVLALQGSTLGFQASVLSDTLWKLSSEQV